MTVSVKGKTETAEKATPIAVKKANIMIGGVLKRYMLADPADPKAGRLFEAGIEYPVTLEERARLFKLLDENGMRIFWDANIIKEQMRHANAKRRQQLAAAGDEDAALAIAQESLMDTGAVKLEDADGNVTGVNT